MDDRVDGGSTEHEIKSEKPEPNETQKLSKKDEGRLHSNYRKRETRTANDVSMITEAHIGIGTRSWKETETELLSSTAN